MENMFGMINGKYFGEPPVYVNKNFYSGEFILFAIKFFPFFLVKVSIGLKSGKN